MKYFLLRQECGKEKCFKLLELKVEKETDKSITVGGNRINKSSLCVPNSSGWVYFEERDFDKARFALMEFYEAKRKKYQYWVDDSEASIEALNSCMINID